MAIQTLGQASNFTVQVQTQSLARNNGYHSDGTMLIALDSVEGGGANAVGDAGAMALFVAEMSEVLMSYRCIPRRRCSASTGPLSQERRREAISL